MMKKIDKNLIENISSEAKRNSRLRKNFNIHDSEKEVYQRLLNAVEPGSYIRPHRHIEPPKAESFIILKGRMGVLEFNDQGSVVESVLLDEKGPVYGIDIPVGVWHTIIALDAGTVVFESKPGPYMPVASKDFAPWAPTPEEGEKALEFLRVLEKNFAI